MPKTQKISFSWFISELSKRTGKSLLLIGFITNLLSYTVPIFIMNVYDKVIPNDYESLLYVMVFMAVSFCILFYIFSSFIDFKIRGDIGSLMSDAEDIITRMIPNIVLDRKDPDHDEFFYLQAKMAISNIVENIGNINVLAFVDIPFSIICFGLIFYLGGSLGYIPLIVFVIIILLNIASQKHIKTFIESSFLYKTKASQNQAELCQKQLQIKLYNLGDMFFERHKLYQSPKNAIQYRSLQAKVDNLCVFISMVSNIIIITVGANKIAQGDLLVGNLVAISFFSGKLFFVARLSKVLYNIKLLKLSLNKISKFYEKSFENISINESPVSFNDISCNDLSFSFIKNTPILKGVNIKISRNATYIEGKGSSGKTTLFNNLALIRKPQKGGILINGVDAKNFNEKDIRKKVHFSCSEQAFFSGTISENIFLSNKVQESMLFDEVLEILELKPRILRSGITLDQVIGGQLKLPFSFTNVQLLKIARALLYGSDIIIFDDPFVGLDQETADMVEKAINVFCKKYNLGLCILSSRKPKIKYDQHFLLDNGTLKINV